MKKTVALLMICILIFSFSACGKSAKKTSATETKVLRVGMECAYAPYNWSQSDSSNGAVKIHDSEDYAYGYDVMMAKYVAEKMGYKLEIHKLDWNALPIAVKTGKIDCAIAGQSITADRLKEVDFTTPYYYASIVTLALKDSKYASAKGLSDFKGASSTSQVNTVWYNSCISQIPNVNKLTACDKTSTMLSELETKKCDLVVTDRPTAMAACVAYKDMIMLDFTGKTDNFKVSDEEINIGISVKKGNKELLDKLNKGLKTLTAYDFDKMMNEAISVQPLSKK